MTNIITKRGGSLFATYDHAASKRSVKNTHQVQELNGGYVLIPQDTADVAPLRKGDYVYVGDLSEPLARGIAHVIKGATRVEAGSDAKRVRIHAYIGWGISGLSWNDNATSYTGRKLTPAEVVKLSNRPAEYEDAGDVINGEADEDDPVHSVIDTLLQAAERLETAEFAYKQALDAVRAELGYRFTLQDNHRDA